MAERYDDRTGGVMQVIRENPFPTALIVIGTAWLFANHARSRRSISRRSVDPWQSEKDLDRDYSEFRAHYRAYGESLSGEPRESREYLREARGDANETMGAVRRSGQRAQGQLQRMLTENPLLVGAGALALGAAFGMALPETEREREMMGETRGETHGVASSGTS